MQPCLAAPCPASRGLHTQLPAPPLRTPCAVVHMVASCRRERVIERATRQRMEKRTASRKAAIDAAEAAAAENSRWRQTYSDRMAVRLQAWRAGWRLVGDS